MYLKIKRNNLPILTLILLVALGASSLAAFKFAETE